jgi:hypothetical protein
LPSSSVKNKLVRCLLFFVVMTFSLLDALDNYDGGHAALETFVKSVDANFDRINAKLVSCDFL